MGFLMMGLVLLFTVQQLNVGSRRDRFIARYGAASFAVGSIAFLLAGLALVCGGYAGMSYVHLWQPPIWLRVFLLPLMFLAFICVAAEFVPSNLKRYSAHPVCYGVVLWALAHLSVRGDMAGVVLFVGLGLVGLSEVVSGRSRVSDRQTALSSWRKESLTVAVGGSLFAVFFYLHMDLFGSSPSMLRSTF